MTAENLNVEAVQQMADITQTYTTAIAVVGVFMEIYKLQDGQWAQA